MGIPLIFTLTLKGLVEKNQLLSSQIPVWLLVMAGILIVVFTVLLIISPRGSNKRRGKRRSIL